MTQAESRQPPATPGETLHLPPPPTLYVEVYRWLNLLLREEGNEGFWQLNKSYANNFIAYWTALKEVCLRAENQGWVTTGPHGEKQLVIDGTTLRFKLRRDHKIERDFLSITKDEGSQTEEARIYPPNGPLRKLTIAFKDKGGEPLLASTLQIEEGVISLISVKTIEKHPIIPGISRSEEESLLINPIPAGLKIFLPKIRK